ncbi:MAG: ABC transporter permease [Bacillota bacterium]
MTNTGMERALASQTTWHQMVSSNFMKGLRRFYKKQPLGVVSGIIVVLLLLIAILAPVLAPYGPYVQDTKNALKSPGAPYYLGTDPIGRDMLSRIIYGARISLIIGFSSVLFSVFFGTIIGSVSGYAGGWVDLIIQRIMDAAMSFPTLVLALAIMAMLGPSVFNVVVVIGLVSVPPVARVVRGEVLKAKENDYVQAAKAIGVGELRILFRHILPNIVSPIIVVATVLLSYSILAEASLSFLGMGTPPPIPSWGLMLGGSQVLMERSPWLAIFPGLAISLTVLAFNLLGDALRDFLDPRLRGI